MCKYFWGSSKKYERICSLPRNIRIFALKFNNKIYLLVMTVKQIYELRQKGHIEEAYDAVRKLYAIDKGAYSSIAMFWVAVDVLRKRMREGRMDEAYKIILAIKRMLPNLPDKDGRMHSTFDSCQRHFENSQNACFYGAPEHIKLGRWGEDLAVNYLTDKGYVILERDWNTGHRDIDIVAQDGDVVVFVEVKTRSNSDFGGPLTAMTYAKRKNLCHAINHYVKYHHIDNPFRFDVVAIVGELGDKEVKIEHIEDFPIM